MNAPASRSFVHRLVVEAGARFGDIGEGTPIAVDYGDESAEAAAARELAIADLSPLARTGFKGPAAIDWLAGQGLALAAEPNRAFPQADGLVAVLSWGETLILDTLAASATLPARLDAAWSLDVEGVYRVPRADSHAWFAIAGLRAPEMLAKVSAIDFRTHKFAPHRIAQTSIARMNGIVLRDDLGRTPCFHVLADSAGAAYLWGALRDAMGEWSAGPAGLHALRRVAIEA